MSFLSQLKDFAARILKQEYTLRKFESVEELTAFLATDWTDVKEYKASTFDCDDFANALQEAALSRGYIINVYLTVDGTHMKNMAIIENGIYMVEPQTDEVTYYGPLD